MVNPFWWVSLGGGQRSKGANSADWAWGCRLVVESGREQEHPLDNYDCGGAMIERIRATCLVLRQLKQQKFGWQGRGFHSQDLVNNGHGEWCKENKAEVRRTLSKSGDDSLVP